MNKRFRALLIRVLPISLLMAIACSKDPTPGVEPMPTRDVEISWDWSWRYPPMDSVSYYAKQPDVKTVVLFLRYHTAATFEPAAFHRARDSLTRRIDIAPEKVIGRGEVIVHPTGGAHLPDCHATDVYGMAEVDSLWYVKHGFTVRRFMRNK